MGRRAILAGLAGTVALLAAGGAQAFSLGETSAALGTQGTLNASGGSNPQAARKSVTDGLSRAAASRSGGGKAGKAGKGGKVATGFGGGAGGKNAWQSSGGKSGWAGGGAGAKGGWASASSKGGPGWGTTSSGKGGGQGSGWASAGGKTSGGKKSRR